MPLPRTSRVILGALFTSALCVSASLAQPQSAPATNSKPGTAKPHAKTRHGKPARRSSARERGQKAPTADRISEIQMALGKDGSFAGSPNGKWDAATVDAVKRFQVGHGLTPTGKLDAKTLQKLGLGSQTAGLAPPMPPVSSSLLNNGSAAAVPRR